jgi:hypothetical protein
MVGYARERLFSYKQLSSRTTEGRQFKKDWEADRVASSRALPFTDEQIDTAIENMNAFLAKAHIKPIAEKFTEYKARRKKNPNWYSIDGGPDSIEQLSVYLKRAAFYNVLYRHWSAISHATDFSNFIAPKRTGSRSGMKGLRDAKHLRDIYTFSATFMIEGTRRMLLKFRPGEENGFSKWYESDIRERYLKITRMKLETTYLD